MKENETHHPKAKNLMGGIGCKTREGNQCFACCGKVYRIDDPPGFKNANEVCMFASKDGCEVHDSEIQPSVCRIFHCENILEALKNPMLSENLREIALGQAIALINEANRLGVISEDDASIQRNEMKALAESPLYSLTGKDE